MFLGIFVTNKKTGERGWAPLAGLFGDVYKKLPLRFTRNHPSTHPSEASCTKTP